MKSINSLDSIRVAGEPLESPTTEINLEAGNVRIPLLFLIDVSGSMASALPTINNTLTKLMTDIYNAEGAEKFMVDFAIITFGGNGVKIPRGFDLLKPDEIFHIKECDGMTPLGEAMLKAYYYTAKRKQKYKEVDLARYNQPTVVLITDFFENNSNDAVINGHNVSGKDLYKEMAELYSEAYSKTYKQYTYSITLGSSVDEAKRNQLKVDIVNDKDVDIATALKRVISNYKASLAVANPVDVMEAVVAASDDFSKTSQGSEDSSQNLGQWQDKAQKVNPLDEVVEC